MVPLPQKNFQPNFDQKKTDLDIYWVLKMSKNGFHEKSFGNACFLKHSLRRSGKTLESLEEKCLTDGKMDKFLARKLLDIFRSCWKCPAYGSNVQHMVQNPACGAKIQHAVQNPAYGKI